MRHSFATLAAVTAALALAPAVAFGQAGGQFTGSVTDNTGGILPGVTVEASSPALIEGSRVAITDGAGRYTIVDLRPGVYTITFTLPGFSTAIVEQQELPAGFTATVNAELSVGALEETVTVSGEAPVVDIQSISQAEVLDRELLDAIPTGRNMQSTAQLIPGVKMNRPEVGLTTAAQQTYMSVHGMSVRQVTTRMDGQLIASSGGDGAVQNYNNQLAIAEMVYETSGIPAETSAGGVRISMIPSEGGNTHSGQQYFGFADGSLQSENLSQRFRDRGGQSTEAIDYTYDYNVAHGGPFIRDRLWFFGSFRRYSINVPVTNSFYQNRAGTTSRYFDPDPVLLNGEDGRENLPGINDDRITTGLLRLTTQLNESNKFSAYMDRIIKQRFHDYDARVDVATASRHHGSPIYYVGTAKWTSTLSNRLLLEVGYSTNVENWSNVDQEAEAPFGPADSLKPGGVHSQPLPAGLTTCVATPCYSNDPNQYDYNGTGMPHPWYMNTLRRDTGADFADRYHWGSRNAYVERFNYNGSLSYVTGSHNLKVGIMSSWGPFRLIDRENGSLRQRYRNGGVPYQIGRSNRPIDFSLYYRDVAAYAQDTWTIDRLTLNLGLRWETINATVDPTDRGRDYRWTRAVTLDGKENLPDWSSIAPRIGFAYDLFGDASTALKFSWGRYNASTTHSLADRLATGKDQRESLPWFDCALNASNQCASRAELQALGLNPDIAYGARQDQYVVGAAGTTGHQQYGGTNGDDFVQDWEVAPGNPEFGGALSTAQLDPNATRPWVGLTNVGLERELWRGFSASFNYYRRDSYGALLEVNRALSLSDYNRFTIPNPCAGTGGTAPSGFPCSTRGIAGQATLPVFVRTPDAQARVPDLWYESIGTDDGYSETYTGWETGFNARLDNGMTFFGAYTVERNILERCDSKDDPNELLFCNASDFDVPWLHEFKLSGTVPLPYDFQFSATFQSYTPRELLATTDFAGDSASGLNGGGGLWGSLLRLGNVSHSVGAADYPADIPFTGSVVIPLMPGGSTFLDRLNQFDVSVRRVFTLPSGHRFEVQADVYNLLNNAPILEATNRFGSATGRPLRTIQGRFLQFATNLYW